MADVWRPWYVQGKRCTRTCLFPTPIRTQLNKNSGECKNHYDLNIILNWKLQIRIYYFVFARFLIKQYLTFILVKLIKTGLFRRKCNQILMWDFVWAVIGQVLSDFRHHVATDVVVGRCKRVELCKVSNNISNFLLFLSSLWLFQHTLIVAEPENLINAPMIVGDKLKEPLLFRGVGWVPVKFKCSLW